MGLKNLIRTKTLKIYMQAEINLIKFTHLELFHYRMRMVINLKISTFVTGERILHSAAECTYIRQVALDKWKCI
jgi:hypothetical protein